MGRWRPAADPGRRCRAGCRARPSQLARYAYCQELLLTQPPHPQIAIPEDVRAARPTSITVDCASCTRCVGDVWTLRSVHKACRTADAACCRLRCTQSIAEPSLTAPSTPARPAARVSFRTPAYLPTCSTSTYQVPFCSVVLLQAPEGGPPSRSLRPAAAVAGAAGRAAAAAAADAADAAGASGSGGGGAAGGGAAGGAAALPPLPSCHRQRGHGRRGAWRRRRGPSGGSRCEPQPCSLPG